MADVHPLRPLRPHARADLRSITSPSLEILSAFADGDRARTRSGRARPATAAGTLDEALRPDPREGLFVYRHDFRAESGLEKNRMGVVGLLDPEGDPSSQVFIAQETEPYGVEKCLRDHEERGFQERLLVAGFEDAKFELERHLEKGILVRRQPDLDLKLDGGERHRLWKIEDPELIAELRGFFRGRDCFLIDGLHVYRALRKLRDREPGPQSRGPLPLTVFFNMFDFGMTLRAATLLLPGAAGFNINDLALRLNSFFEIRTYPFAPASLARTFADFREDLRLRGFTESAVGACFAGVDQFFLFELREGVARREVFLPDVSEALQDFDAVLLRRVIIGRYVAASAGGRDPPALEYAWSPEEALAAVRSGKFGAAFFLNPPQKRKLVDLARSGLRLPPGSARLEPPARAGLVVHPLPGPPGAGGDS